MSQFASIATTMLLPDVAMAWFENITENTLSQIAKECDIPSQSIHLLIESGESVQVAAREIRKTKLPLSEFVRQAGVRQNIIGLHERKTGNTVAGLCYFSGLSDTNGIFKTSNFGRDCLLLFHLFVPFYPGVLDAKYYIARISNKSATTSPYRDEVLLQVKFPETCLWQNPFY